jgi:NADH-quinone oxidoreductase subunit M
MPWLTVTIFLPLAGVLFVFLVPRHNETAARGIALATTLLTFAASLGILANFDTNASGYQLVDSATWVSSIGLRYAVGVDGISLFLVLLTTFLFVIAVLASFRETPNVRALMATILALETFVLGTFLSLDLLLFFLFFEATLLPGYLLIAGWGGERRASAAIKFFIYTMAGSAFLFLAVLFVYFQAHTFDIRVLAQHAFAVNTGRWLFLGFLVAFAVKAPIVPFHAWQPDAYTEAPTGALLILAGVLPKIATYGLLRFNIGLFPEAANHFRGLVEVLALIGIIYGAVVAIVQTDLKRLIAYSSISHVGFIVLGLFAFTQQGISGSVLYMVNHALSTGLLFVMVGLLYERMRTRDIGRLGGVASITPKMAAFFLVAGLASMGLPGLNNFVSEFLVILGTFGANRVWGSIAAVGVLLSAIYFLWAYQRSMHGPMSADLEARLAHASPTGGDPASDVPAADEPDRRRRLIPDITRWEYLVIVPVMVVILFLGLYPKPVLDRVNPASCRSAVAVDNPGYTPLVATCGPPGSPPVGFTSIEGVPRKFFVPVGSLSGGWTMYAPPNANVDGSP